MIQCKRSDGRRWRCSRPVTEGKEYCNTHFLQYCHRLKHEPVPAALKIPRAPRNKSVPELEQKSPLQLDGDYEAPVRRGRKRKEPVTDDTFEVRLTRKRSGLTVNEEIVELSDQLEDGSNLAFQDANLHLYNQGYERAIVKDLMYGQMVIPQPLSVSPQLRTLRTLHKKVSPTMKVRVPSATKFSRRTMHSKNDESDPFGTVQMLPKENVKASAKKNIIKKCHWCKYTSYRVLVQCSTCKTQFFCQECIDRRFYCKTAIKRECPVCEGTCDCRPCLRRKPKEVKTKESVLYDSDEGVTIYIDEDEVAIDNREDEVAIDNREDAVAIYNAEDEVAIDNREDEVAIDNREDEVAIDNREDAVAIYNAEDEVAIDNREDEVAIDNREDAVAIYNAEDEVAIDNREDEVAIDNREDAVAIYNAEDEVAIDNREDEVAIDNREDEVAIHNLEDEVAIDNLEDEVAIDNLEDEVAIDNREDEVAIGNREDEMAIFNTEDEVAIDNGEDEVAIDNGEDEVAIHNLEDEVAIYIREDEVAIYSREDDVAVSIREKEVVVYNRAKKFDKTQQLHMIRLLLPIIEKINQEKMNELEIEARNKGRTHAHVHLQLTESSKKPKCSFCSSWVTDIHRSCESCSYILCIYCCEEFREGSLHSGLNDLRNTRLVRSKSRKISWKFSIDGNIRCPPQTLGGCSQDFLQLTSFSPIGFTKDLEVDAKQITNKYKFKKLFGVVSSPCLLCDGNNESGSEKVGNLVKNKGLYFKTKQDFIDKDLKHFMKHWGKGQPVMIRDVLKSQQYLNWDFGYLLCKYLERSAGMGKSVGGFDICDVQFGRKQIYIGGKTYENVWQELLRFKVTFSSSFFQEKFPDHYAVVMESLPVQEYITGFMNLAMNGSRENGNPNFGPRVCISYGESNLTDTDLIKKLCYHPYDVVNTLAYATDHQISEEKLNEVKILMNKYNSQEHMKLSKKIKMRNELEKLFGNSPTLKEMNNDEVDISSDDLSTEYSDSDSDSDHEVSVYSQHEFGSSSHYYKEEQVVETHGAEWDIFKQEDIPKLLEYLKKYSDKLSKSCGSPEKVVHPLFDEVFYLDELHKLRIKEEFNVEPWSFEQHIGEAVIIPAGCPYQMKKIKSCVNVVMDFISPESATNCIKVSDEIRRLPVNHKAKGKIPKVKNMVINGMHAAIEEIHMISET